MFPVADVKHIINSLILGKAPGPDGVSTQFYPGVTLNAQLSWDDHIKNVVFSANRMLGLIKTIAFNSSISAKFSLYKSLMLPILE